MTKPALSATTDSLVRLLDVADALPGAAELRARSYDLLQLSVGARVVDVGCGAGRAVAELAGRGVRPVGVDVDEGMVIEARRRWPECEFRVGSALALPMAEGTFAGYRADKVFHELADPAAAVAEARRVLAPGGRVVLLGQDWEMVVIDSDRPSLTRSIVEARAEAIASPRAARGYRNLLLDAGFGDVVVEVRTAIFTGEAMFSMLVGFAHVAREAGVAGVDEWIGEQRRRAEADRLLVAMPLFIAAASCP